MLDDHTLRQLRGAADLTTNAVGATVGAVARAHSEIAHLVYTPLMLLGPVSAPVRLVAAIEGALAGGVYRAIHAGNAVVAAAAGLALDEMERRV
jgi:hypothetical protein